MNLKRSAARGTVAIGISQGAMLFLQLGSQILLARLLFPDDFGLLAMITPVIGLMQLLNNFGLSQVLIMRENLEHDQVSSLFWINLVLGVLLGIIVALIAPIASWFFGEPRLMLLMVAAGLLLPLGSLGIHPQSLLRRQMRFSYVAWNDIAASASGLLITILAASAGWSYWALLVGQCWTTLFGNLLAWAACGWRPSLPRIERGVWATLEFGGNITGTHLATYLTTAGDNAIIAFRFGSVTLGLFDRSYSLVTQPITQILSPISTTAIPLLARLRDDDYQYREVYLSLLQCIIILFVPLAMTCAIFSHDVISLILGSHWAAAAPIFSWISVGSILSAVYSSSQWLFQSQERVHEMMRIAVVCSLVNLAAFIVGSFFGVIGIAAAGALSFLLVNNPLTFWTALRRGAIRPADFVPVIAYHYLLAGIAALLMFLARGIMPETDVSARIAAGLAISYGIMALGVATSARDRARISKVVSFVWHVRR